MAIEVALDDDLFFADLNRRICMLIDDDDDVRVTRFGSVSRQEFPRMVAHQQPSMYQANHVRETSKGTGVFIPQSSLPRRRSKHFNRASFNSNKNKRFTTDSRDRSYVQGHDHATFSPAYTTTNINGC
ncbi:hypothetical protein vseg_014968 [Gypsophila vaccaria]